MYKKRTEMDLSTSVEQKIKNKNGRKKKKNRVARNGRLNCACI